MMCRLLIYLILSYFLSTLSVFASIVDSCPYFLYSNKQFTAHLNKKSKKLDVLAEKVLESPLNDRVLFALALDRASAQDITRLLKLYQTNPKYFNLIENEVDVLRLARELLEPGSAEAIYQRPQKIVEERNIVLKDFLTRDLTDIETSVQNKKKLKNISAIYNFLIDWDRVFLRMQELENEVVVRAYLVDVDFAALKNKDKKILKEKQMLEIFMNREAKHGFTPVKSDRYNALALSEKDFSEEDWFKMLRAGKMFNDTIFLVTRDVTGINATARGSHGYYTHRIQWHLVMRDMDKNPDLYGEKKGVELFKLFGSTVLNREVSEWYESNLWDMVFDGFRIDNYTSPEYLRKHHVLFPDLGAWQ